MRRGQNWHNRSIEVSAGRASVGRYCSPGSLLLLTLLLAGLAGGDLFQLGMTDPLGCDLRPGHPGLWTLVQPETEAYCVN